MVRNLQGMFGVMSESTLLKAVDLKVHFPLRTGVFLKQTGAVKAVDGVSLELGVGETLGLVGESGCGKSTLGKALVRLIKPTSGTVDFQGRDITNLRQAQLLPLRRDFQMIFQDPAESLDARMSVRSLIEEPYRIHKLGNRMERKRWVDDLLDTVGLSRAAADKYSFEFSGGQKQRIGIARALALKPKWLVCDEPVSALDVSVQSQILNLLVDLQKEFSLSYLFIAHNLSVVKHISDKVAVMYLGKIVELADSEALYRNPKHAYTKALLSAVPIADPKVKRKKILLEGDVPSPIDPPLGSAFGHRIRHPRCAETIGMDLSLREIEPSHWVAADPTCLEPEDWEKLSKA